MELLMNGHAYPEFLDFLHTTITSAIKNLSLDFHKDKIRTKIMLLQRMIDAKETGFDDELKRAWLETAFKSYIVNHMEVGEVEICMKIVDVSIVASEDDLVDETCPLSLIEDLADCSSLDTIKIVFDYMESRVVELTKGIQPNKGKGLILLRLCNEMLRRLSKMEYPQLCGRILTLLASVFPLAERSGVNLKGSFNTDNVTLYNGRDRSLSEILSLIPVDQDTNLAELEKDPENAYLIFWRLQDLFMTAPNFLNSESFSHFQKIFDFCLGLLDMVHKYEKEMSRSDSRDTFDFMPKYLTDKSLFMLQLRNNNFRRTIFTQMIIMLSYLRKYFADESAKTLENSSSDHLESPFPAIEDNAWITKLHLKIMQLLEDSPDGPAYVSMLRSITDRENTWIEWKKASCKTFERKPIDLDDFKDDDLKPFVAKHFLGAPEMAKLWKLCENLALEDNEHICIPKFSEFVAELKEQMDPEAQIEKELRLSSDNEFCWKAFRLASTEYLSVFQRIINFDVEQLVTEVEASGKAMAIDNPPAETNE